MASRISSKNQAAKGVEVSVGDKVSKFFKNHELDDCNLPSQWIHGQVVGFKETGKRGGKASTKWWSLKFPPPFSSKLMCCSTEEVVLMLHAAEVFRCKRHGLEKQLGKQLVVAWSREDSDLSIRNLTMPTIRCVS